jgi:multisubunit Na+/H+ antiporter MnhF subunit
VIVSLAAFAALSTAGLLLPRLVTGPTLLDRLSAAHGIWTCCALALAAVGVGAHRHELIALAFVLTLAQTAVLLGGIKALRLGSFQAPLARLAEDEKA